jgi:hypothetical protein
MAAGSGARARAASRWRWSSRARPPTATPGRIALVVAVNTNGLLSGVRVTQHKETPGLGDYIDPKKDRRKDLPWIGQFAVATWKDVNTAEWTVRKDGGTFGYRTGATISARAVVRAAGPQHGVRGRTHGRALRRPRRRRAGRMSMSPQQFREIAWNGLWKQNTGLAQLLGLCPILAVSTSMVNAVSLGLATILVMALSNLACRRCATSSPTRSASRSSS